MWDDCLGLSPSFGGMRVLHPPSAGQDGVEAPPRRDGVVPPFALGGMHAAREEGTRRKADPADGFLAGLSQLATFTPDSNGLEHI